MKEETKELLEYIILQFSTRKNTKKEMSVQDMEDAIRFNERNQKIQDFLRSIPEIEEKLCFGGYIQDKNGVPCCQGDKVNVPFQDFIGTLKWDLPTRRFVVVCDNGTEWSLSSWEFEKVDE